MAKPEEYGISVRQVQEDGVALYEARVAELPDVRTYGEKFSDAYLSALDVIATTQKIFAEKGKSFPDVETVEDEFSGRITLRMSKSLHRAAHGFAQRDGVSLNQWIVEAVGCRIEPPPASAQNIVVISPMKQAARPDQPTLCIQHATPLGALGTGSTVVFTGGVVEANTIYSHPQPLLGSSNKGIGYEQR